ncbi:MAG TPA: PilZ domain-containing protein [Dissulfurispiraceae bacterium]|nr:PilZ domain-containing protein [Dissulfurispiraceae bacterium]
MEELSSGLTTGELRAWSRVKCDLSTMISVPWGESWDCRIINMSGRGFGIITNAKLRAGDVVQILEPKTKAKVIWCNGNMAGLKVTN